MIHRLGPAASRQPEHLTRASHRAQAMSNLLHHHLGHDPKGCRASALLRRYV